MDRLNASTAYFPTVQTGVFQREPIEEEGEDEGELEGEDQEIEESNWVQPVHEVNEGEEHDNEEEE